MKSIGINRALAMHFQSRLFPPVSPDFIPAARRAIRVGNRANVLFHDGYELEANDLWKQTIRLPNGRILTVSAVLEGLHLDEFLSDDE